METDIFTNAKPRKQTYRYITTINSILQCLSAQAGLKAGLSANEVEEILTLSKSQPIKDKLKSVTQEALEYKVSVFYLCLCTLSLSHQNVFVVKNIIK